MSDKEERDMSFGVENTELGDGSRLFMARDSFGRALLPWMIDSYETSFFRRTDAPDLHDLAPGTDVVFEIVERNLGRLIAKAPFVYAPQRADRDPAALPLGGTLTAALEDSGSVHLYGAFPAGTELGSGRVYLRLEQDGRTLCLEAFPIRERALLGEDAAASGETETAESGFSAYLDPALALSGTWQLTVLTDAAAWPCNPVELPPAG